MKKWYQSRTVLIAVGQAIVAGIASYVTSNPGVETAGYLLMFKSIVDIVLRMNTTTKIS